MDSANITLYRTSPSGDVPPIFMFASANGSIRTAARYSVTTGMYGSSTAHGSTPSSWLFIKMENETTPVGISTLASRNGLNGQTLRKQYKGKISDYRCRDLMPKTRPSGNTVTGARLQKQKKSVSLSDNGSPKGWQMARLCRR